MIGISVRNLTLILEASPYCPEPLLQARVRSLKGDNWQACESIKLFRYLLQLAFHVCHLSQLVVEFVGGVNLAVKILPSLVERRGRRGCDKSAIPKGV